MGDSNAPIQYSWPPVAPPLLKRDAASLWERIVTRHLGGVAASCVASVVVLVRRTLQLGLSDACATQGGPASHPISVPLAAGSVAEQVPVALALFEREIA